MITLINELVLVDCYCIEKGVVYVKYERVLYTLWNGKVIYSYR